MAPNRFFLFENTYTQGDGEARPRIDFEFLKFFDGVRTKWGMFLIFGFFLSFNWFLLLYNFLVKITELTNNLFYDNTNKDPVASQFVLWKLCEILLLMVFLTFFVKWWTQTSANSTYNCNTSKLSLQSINYKI